MIQPELPAEIQPELPTEIIGGQKSDQDQDHIGAMMQVTTLSHLAPASRPSLLALSRPFRRPYCKLQKRESLGEQMRRDAKRDNFRGAYRLLGY